MVGEKTEMKPDGQKGKPSFLKKIKCYNCNVKGHFAKDCRKPKRPRKEKNEDSEKKQEVAVSEAIVAEANYLRGKSNDWLIDSGATDHMTHDAGVFITMNDTTSREKLVQLGDDQKIEVKGYGDVIVYPIIEGKKTQLLLKNVLYVPGLRRNLISLGSATNKGCSVTISSTGLEVYNSNKKCILEGKRQGNLYVAITEASLCPVGGAYDTEIIDETGTLPTRIRLRWSKDQDEVPTNDSTSEPGQLATNDNLQLWHERMAHVNKAAITKMKKEGLVSGLEQCKFVGDAKSSDRKKIDCESCCLSKKHRNFIPSKSSPRATRVGERVHADIGGPVGCKTLNGGSYFLLLKDEYSTYRWGAIMKSRDEAFDLVRKYVAELKADTGQTVGTIVSDCGSEFTSNRAQKFFLDNSIVHEKSAPFLPQQNGFIEREMRTTMEATRAMLFHSKQREELWGEALITAIYTLNRVTNKGCVGSTPYELYTGKKPRIEHMRIFGCVAYMKCQEKKRSGYQKKIEARAVKLVLVGYAKQDFTYRLLDPATKKVTYSREVEFDERMASSGEIDYPNLDGILTSETRESTTVSEELETNVVTGDEPTSVKEALEGPDRAQWQKAMDEEYKSLVKNQTWSLQKAPADAKLIKCKWVFKRKPDKFKARLVAKGYSQQAGIDFHEVFSPVAKLESIRVILALAALRKLSIIHFDVKTAFLHGKLEEEIWMMQPEGYEQGKLACKLSKSLYGLKQASRVWNSCFTNFLKEFKLTPCLSDSCVYLNPSENVILAIYVDDGLLVSNNTPWVEMILSALNDKFEITRSKAECYVGLEIQRDLEKGVLLLHQKSYTSSILEKFHHHDGLRATVPMSPLFKPTKTGVIGHDSSSVSVPYRELIGSLIYLANGTRPDIAFAVSTLARYCEDPRLVHWNAAKQVVKYLSGTTDCGILYGASENRGLQAFTDADYATCTDSRKSVTGVVIKYNGGPVIWKSTKQSTVAESTTEAEFIAASSGSREVSWLRQFIQQIEDATLPPTPVFVDNQAAIRLIKNNQVNTKIKHLDVKLFAVREREEKGEITVSYVETKEQQADIMTKPLAPILFLPHRKNLSVISLLTLFVLTAITADAVKMKWLKGLSSGDVTRKRIVLELVDPCKWIKVAEASLRGPVDLSNKTKYDTGIVDAINYLCTETFNNKVIPAFKSIDGCLAHREKRDLSSLVTGIQLVSTVIIGVTNLIKGISEETTVRSQETIAKLTGSLNDSTVSTLTDQNFLAEEAASDMVVVSHSGDDHMDILNDESKEFPMVLMSAFHVASELHAGIANLKAIRMHCQNGKLATQELAEMLEISALSDYAPEDTVLERVLRKELELEFYYKLDEPFVTKELIGMVLVILTLLVLFVTVIRSNLHLTNAVKVTTKPVAVPLARRLAIDL